MKRCQRRWLKTVLGLAGGVLAAMAAGCATILLSEVSTVADDEAAYLVFGAQGRLSKQAETGRRIVQRRFAEIKKRRPPDSQKQLERWTGYLAELNKPIEIDGTRYRQAPELRNVDNLETIAAYVHRNARDLRLTGAEVSDVWRQEQEKVRAVVARLESIVERARQAARAAIQGGDVPAAYVAMLEAYAVAAGVPQVAQTSQRIQDGLGAQTVKDLEKGVQLLMALAPGFGTEKSGLATLRPAAAVLSGALDRLATLDRGRLAHGIPYSDPALADQIENLRGQAVKLVGAAWGEEIRLCDLAGNYWDAYQAAAGDLAHLGTFPPAARKAIRGQVVEAFEPVVSRGMSNLLDQANGHFHNEYFGLAYIASRMCRELYDFAGAQGIAAYAAQASLAKKADDTAADSVVRIGSRHARRLLVFDFIPAVTEDYENLGFQIRSRLRRLADTGNPWAWGLEVPTAPSLPQVNAKDLPVRDMAYYGTMEKKVSVELLPPKELERGYAEVGTDRITVIPNPWLQINNDEPVKKFKSQEIHLYPWVKTLHGKQAKIALQVVREDGRGSVRPVYKLDAVFPNARTKFTNLAIECETLAYSPFVVGSPKIVSDYGEELAIDQPPTGQAPSLASDDDVKRAVINRVLEEILAAITKDVLQYPVEAMALPAVDFQNRKQSRDAAENWGHFLAYVQTLSSSDVPEDADWIARRTVMQEKVNLWCRTRWSSQPKPVVEVLPEAWRRACDAYRAAQP